MANRQLPGDHTRSPDPALLELADLRKHFAVRGSGWRKEIIRAVDGVSLTLARGQTLGLVGESGCGKTTLARTILGLHPPTSGEIRLDGHDLVAARGRRLRRLRRHMQVVFQDPYASLDPKMSVHDIIAEPLRINRRPWRDRVAELLQQVGLGADAGRLRPEQFSGGQRQRIGIARALALEPELLILDEPVSALDVSIQAQVINLLKRLQSQLGLSYLFIAHDLSVVRHICDRVAVMHLGKIVEIGPRDQVLGAPTHPYTQSLLSAAPTPDPAARHRRQRIVLRGDPPNPADPPSGCSFRTRCFKAADVCAADEPQLRERADRGRLSACHFAALPGPGNTEAAGPGNTGAAGPGNTGAAPVRGGI
ncbi:MAG: ABC transporter ATP-binding protein [Micromonosporaceae bacterium]